MGLRADSAENLAGDGFSDRGEVKTFVVGAGLVPAQTLKQALTWVYPQGTPMRNGLKKSRAGTNRRGQAKDRAGTRPAPTGLV